MKNLLLILSLLTFTHIPLMAGTLDGVKLADSVTIDGKKLVLNGMGTRKATWFKVKVYVGGLYLPAKSKDPKAILSQPFPKYINMHFVRDVEKEKLVGGWNDAFKSALGEDKAAKMKPMLDKFNATMANAKEGDEILLTFLEKGVKVKFGKSAEKLVEGKELSTSVLSVWFVNAADEGLRDGFLGIK